MTKKKVTHIGKIIQNKRKSKKLTQLQLANLVDIPQGNISRIESGSHKPSNETLIKLSKILNLKSIRLDDLMKEPELEESTTNDNSLDDEVNDFFSEENLKILHAYNNTFIEIAKNLKAENRKDIWVYYHSEEGQNIAKKHGFDSDDLIKSMKKSNKKPKL